MTALLLTLAALASLAFYSLMRMATLCDDEEAPLDARDEQKSADWKRRNDRLDPRDPEREDGWVFANLPNWAMLVIGFLLFAVLPVVSTYLGPDELDAARRVAAAGRDVERGMP